MPRVTLSLSETAAQRLLELAGSQRKQADYIGALIDAAWENQRAGAGVGVERMRLQIVGLAAEVQDLRARLLEVEARGR